MKRWIKGMRDAFSDSLYGLARKDKRIILITADTGAICHDKFKRNLSSQYINVGIAEQNMVGIAAGLAMSGKIVYVYALVPFATARCYEQIKVDLCCMKLPVNIVGIGPGFDYSTLGPTHHGTEDIALMRSLPEMNIYSPCDSISAEAMVEVTYSSAGPKYIRLDRIGFPLVYKNKKNINIAQGFSLLKEGRDLYIIATGRMVYNALQVARRLSVHSIRAGVVDLFKIKPMNKESVLEVIGKTGRIVTLEEHFISGGIGSLICETLASEGSAPVLKSIGIPLEFCRKYGSREYLQRINRIDIDSVTDSIRKWLKK